MFGRASLFFALVVLGVLAGTADSASGHGDLLVTSCDPPAAASSQNGKLRGIVFSADRPFFAVEIGASGIAGTHEFSAELRRSSGFEGPPEATSGVSVNLTPVSSTVHIDFEPIPVAGDETFSLRFVDVVSPLNDTFFFDGESEYDGCPDVTTTAEIEGPDPEPREVAPVFVVLSGHEIRFVWGDSSCEGQVAAHDAFPPLRYALANAVAPAGGGCPQIGTNAGIDGVPRIWGDWDCGGGVGTGDVLVILAAIADVDTPIQDCPAVGEPIEITL
jgi:hypothetical protein